MAPSNFALSAKASLGAAPGRFQQLVIAHFLPLSISRITLCSLCYVYYSVYTSDILSVAL